MAGKVLSNMSWKFAERIMAQVVTLLVSVILARLLMPSDYGIIAIVTVFITLANVFVSDGFGNALIQKKDADKLDFATILYFNIAFSIVLYLILFFTAPYIAKFYGEGYEILSPVLRVLGLRVIISGVNSVQQAYVAKKMIFRKFFWATLFGTLTSAVVGIWLAYAGYGVWALVAQYLTNTTIGTVVLMITLHRIPPLKFSFKRLKEMFGFGAKILGTNLLITGFIELKSLLIGKIYTSEELAYYNEGKQFPNLIVANINVSIGAVLFSKMAEEQDDRQKVKNSTRMSIRFSAFMVCPLMLGLLAVASSFVEAILSEKWLPCVPFLQLFCVTYLFQPIHTANMQAIKAIGRSDIYLKLEIAKKVIELIVLLSVLTVSVEAIVITTAILNCLFTFVNAYPNKKLLDYSFKEQMADLCPAMLMSLVMAAVVLPLGLLPIQSKLLLLILQVIVGAIVYFALCLLTKNKEFSYMVQLLQSKLKKKAK